MTYTFLASILAAQGMIAAAPSESMENAIAQMVEVPLSLEQQDITEDQLFSCYSINESGLPLTLSMMEPFASFENFYSWVKNHQTKLKSLLKEHGALLLRDFPVENAEEFAKIVTAVLNQTPMDYRGGEGSRTKVANGVYTSTEAPAAFHIPLHNELSCTDNPPSYSCFYCEIQPEPSSGQTILASTEKITRELLQFPEIWELFEGKILKYISRHPPEGNFFTYVNNTHKTWQESFETQSKEDVERICQEKGFEFQWLGDWVEVIRCARAINAPDDIFGFPYWFNQAHLYHQNPRIRGGCLSDALANLLYIDPKTRQYDIEFDDGSQIPQEVIYAIYDILEHQTVKFDWKKGDVLILDNKKTLHGRAPYSGERRILVSMVQ